MNRYIGSRYPIIDGVGTIKTINNHSIHTDRTKAKSLGYGNFYTELTNMDTHIPNAHRLPKRSALDIWRTGWRGK